MDKTAHTPTPSLSGPFRAMGISLKAESPNGNWYVVARASVSAFTRETAESMAIYLERTCNTHAALVGALEDAAKRFDKIYTENEKNITASEGYLACEAALKLAKGE